MRHFLVLVLGLVLAACASAPPPPVAPSKLIDTATVADNLRATVIVLRSGTESGVCAGTAVPGGMLTAAHCVPPASGCTEGDCAGALVRFVTYDVWQRNDELEIESGVAVAVDHDLDLAFVRAKLTEKPAPIGKAAEVGDRVYSIGHPDGQWYTIADGLIVVDREDAMRVAIPVWGGSSGGGLFDQHGRLIGVASRMQRPSQREYSAAAYFVSPSAVVRFLAAVPAAAPAP